MVKTQENASPVASAGTFDNLGDACLCDQLVRRHSVRESVQFILNPPLTKESRS
jgi:hypothetical protein